MTPYATVTQFKADKNFSISDKNQDDVLMKLKEMTSENMFSAVKISGTFKNACTYDAWSRTTLYTSY